MKDCTKLNQKNQLVKVIGVLVFIIFLILISNSGKGSPVISNLYQSYNEGWLLENGKSAEIIDLPDVIEADADQKYSISRKIDEELSAESAIVFRSQQQKVNVYVDEQLIYQYPEKAFFADIVPSNWNFVRLGDEMQGKTLRIGFESPYRCFAGRIGEVYFGNYNELVNGMRYKQLLPFLFNFLIGIIGIIILVVTFWIRRHRNCEAEEMLGILFIFASIWLCGESKMPIAFIDPAVQYFITFISLLMIPICFTAYLAELVKGRSEKITSLLFYVHVVSGIVILSLQLLGIRDFVELIGYIHLSIGFSFLYGIYIYGEKIYKKEDGYSRSGFFCLIFVGIVALVEVVLFYTNRYQRIGIYISGVLFIYAVCLFGINMRKIYQKLEENGKLMEQLHESRIELMMSQIQPHFIYNTLGAIRVLIKTSPDEAYQMVYDFSTYLRANIDSISKQKQILFSEELNHIRAYINIEKVRFGERLQVIFDIQEELFYISPLCVQALVENAIKHGVCQRPEGGCVWIRSYKKGDDFMIEVEDNGVGFNKDEVVRAEDIPRSSAGIRNIEFRLKEISNADIVIYSVIDKGTKVAIKIPEQK